MAPTLPLRRMTSALGVFREKKSDASLATLQVFLVVAENPGISSRDIMARAGVTQSAVSRHMSILGEQSWTGGEGMGLITSREDPQDRRVKVSSLTPKGIRFAERIIAALDPDTRRPVLSSTPKAEKQDGIYYHRSAKVSDAPVLQLPKDDLDDSLQAGP